jgi:hypothetical protein
MITLKLILLQLHLSKSKHSLPICTEVVISINNLLHQSWSHGLLSTIDENLTTLIPNSLWGTLEESHEVVLIILWSCVHLEGVLVSRIEGNLSLLSLTSISWCLITLLLLSLHVSWSISLSCLSDVLNWLEESHESSL